MIINDKKFTYKTTILLSSIITAILITTVIGTVSAQEELFCGLPESSYNVIQGTNNAEILIGTNNDDLILALNGDDYIRARGGNDCIIAGYGNDYINGGTGNDTIFGGPGDDIIQTGAGTDTANGERGDDKLFASQVNDTLDGGTGSDICDGPRRTIMVNCEPTPLRPTPIPANAIGPVIPAKGYLVEEISGGLYWVTEGVYQSMFLVSDEGVILVDAPPSIGENLISAIAEVTTQPVTHFVYTHHHADHVDSAFLFGNATKIAHIDTAEKLMQINDTDRPIPDITFEDNYTLTVGNQTLQLSYAGPSHSPGNIFVYAPTQKVLMIVDIVFPGWSPFKDLATAEDIPAFITIHDDILEFDFDVLVSGHVTRLGTPEDVEIQKEYVSDMFNNVRIAAGTISFGDAFARSADPQNIWLVFDDYLDEVTGMCADLTIPKWQNILGGVDVFTIHHCDALFDSLRVD